MHIVTHTQERRIMGDAWSSGVLREMTILILLLLALYAPMTTGLMCVQCSSKDPGDEGACEDNPPTASACYGSRDTLHCRISRKYNEAGDQIEFSRDCSTVVINKCTFPETEHKDAPYKICYETCDGRGCNTSSRISLNVSLFVCLLVLLTTMYALSS